MRRTFEMVERRWSGLLIVMSVLLAAATIPALGGRMIPGSASIGPIPGPPHVGDCLLRLPDLNEAAVDATGAALYQSLATEPCIGDRWGQVVAVVPGGMLATPVEVADDHGLASFDDPNRHACSTALAQYLDAGGSPAAWSPAITFSITLGRPSDLQRRMGQDWVACVAGASGPEGTATRYEGGLRASTTRDLLPATVPTAAICLSSKDFFLAHTIGCAQPHQVEDVAMLMTHDTSITMAVLESRCHQLVRGYTEMPDPTAGGQLVDAVVAVHRASDGTEAPGLATGDETGFARCLVHTTGSRLLTGTLLGLGDRPLPWLG
jgi:hypothetical protein